MTLPFLGRNVNGNDISVQETRGLLCLSDSSKLKPTVPTRSGSICCISSFGVQYYFLLFGISLSQLTNYDEQDSATPLSEAEAIDLVKTVFASATERDIYTVIFFTIYVPWFWISIYLDSNSKFCVIDRVTNSKSSFLMPTVFVVNTWISEKISMVLGLIDWTLQRP